MKRVYRISTLIVLIQWIVWIPLNAAQFLCNCTHRTGAETFRNAAVEETLCCQSGEAVPPEPEVAVAGEAETGCCDKEDGSDTATRDMHPSWCLAHCLADAMALHSPSAKPHVVKGFTLVPAVQAGWGFSPQKSPGSELIPHVSSSHSVVPLFLRHQSFLI